MLQIMGDGGRRACTQNKGGGDTEPCVTPGCEPDLREMQAECASMLGHIEAALASPELGYRLTRESPNSHHAVPG